MTVMTEAYRRPFWGADDDLFHRCLVVAAVTGFVFLIAVLLAPVRHAVVTRIEQLPERFAKLIVEKPAPPKLPGPEGNRGTPGKPPGAPGPGSGPEPVARVAPKPGPIGPPPTPGGRAAAPPGP